MEKILLIEDDIAITELLKLNLENSGFSVLTHRTMEEAKKDINESISFIILDLNLPDGNGTSIIPTITQKKIPILILTAKDSIADKIKGLNLGADDYMSKPFDSLELIARIRAILRRSSKSSDWIVIDNVKINIQERIILSNEIEMTLTLKEWKLLECFIDNRGYLLSREQLLKTIWGYDYYGTTRTVDVHIQKLRQKLNLTSIITLYKQGYRLEK